MHATISPKGQITIPLEVRQRLGLLPSMILDIQVTDDGKLIMQPEAGSSRGKQALAALRTARGKMVMNTEQIMALTRDWGTEQEDDDELTDDGDAAGQI